MRKPIASLVLTSALAVTVAFAQPPGNPPTAADMVQRRVSMLTTLLSLTTAQQQQATTIFTNAATAESGVRENMKTAHQNLSDAVKNNDTAAIEQAAATIGNLTAQLTAANAKADAAFYQILTPDQQTKLNQFQSQGHGRFGRGPGDGMPGAIGPGGRR